MEFDMYNPTDANDYNETSIGGNRGFNKELDLIRRADSGYNKIYRNAPRASDGKMLIKSITCYTTPIGGSNIRDAETGDYYDKAVGSKHEDLFFKVSLATGECKSKNNSSTLFYISPNNYASHMYTDVSDKIIANWEEKRDKCLKMLDEEANTKKQRRHHVF